MYADTNQFLQVLLNIMLNAIQASPDGGIINVDFNNESDPKTFITISDKGCGIPSQNIDKVFEPFYSSKTYGTGLGLATCKKIIEAHKGNITVQSEPDKGTTFQIILPRKHVNDIKAT